MKVADVMSKRVEYVSTKTPVKNVCRLIFGRGINGLPVVDGKKVVGFITERDVMAKLYPSIQEYIEDPVNMADFEVMENKASEVFRLLAEEIMSKDPVSVSPEMPVLRAQSLMFINKVGRLPVVDDKGNLVGILSKGDIFRTIVGGKISFEEEGEFYNWLAKDYDRINDWRKRIKAEVNPITKVFKKNEVKNVIDVAYSTAEHSIALAKEGIEVFGIETSPAMFKIAKAKVDRLPKKIRDKIELRVGNYEELTKTMPRQYDAAIFMGNGLPHVLYTDKDILKNISKTLKPKGSMMIFQILNFEKILKVNNGFRDYQLINPSEGYDLKEIYFGFYTKETNDVLTITRAVFDYEAGRWVFRRINSTHMYSVGVKGITSLLKKLGFRNISIYGSHFYGNEIFKEKFNPTESDWLNVVAIR